jgi:hypothetical protein
MRATLMFAISAVVALASTVDSSARAENEFDVAVSKGQVVVTAKSGWHINKDYPWKLIVKDPKAEKGETKLTKEKFTLEEKKASVSGAPAGDAKLKGAVCSEDQCHSFEKDVTIK